MFDALLKGRQYRREVMASMDYLLNFQYPEAGSVLLRFYPGIRSAMRGHQERGVTALVSAVEIMTICLTSEVEKLSMAGRATFLEQLRTNVAASDTAATIPLAPMARTFLSNLYFQQDAKQLEEQAVQWAISELVGAAQGLDGEGRASRRMESAINTTLLSRSVG
jgi:hypothetical protein